MLPRLLRSTVAFILTLNLGVALVAAADPPPIEPVPLTAVRFTDKFWAPRLETNRKVSIPHCFRQCEETGRIANFARAGGLEQGPHQGYYFDDSDVYKVMEAAAYVLAAQRDPALDRYLDDLIAKVAAAQEDDGYLYTIRTINPDKLQKACGPTRWSSLAHSHELYCVGHLYEAAVAHFQATTKRSLMDVAHKSLDLVLREFGPNARHDVPGHEEIELALVRLYRLTNEPKYLDLARFFLDERGRAEHHPLYGEYAQDHLPVAQQDAPIGHAVRAGYLYCAMADVARLTHDDAYIQALDKIWHGLVDSRLYITGGVGARYGGEAFGDPYELPNAAAYAETCAGIANIFWNQRMFLLHGDAQYVDVLERALYNGFLSGISLSGDRFFYVNPLASYGDTQREPWFACACCPPNVVRLLASLPGYVYAVRDEELFVNLFVGGTANVTLPAGKVRIVQETDYPWDGRVTLRLTPDQRSPMTLCVRIPSWAQGQPQPGELYRYLTPRTGRWTLKLNGAPIDATPEKGYVRVTRTWDIGDRIELDLPMDIRRVIADDRLTECRERVTLERGPLVYCVEGVDHDGAVRDLVLPDDVELTATPAPDLLGGVVVLRGPARSLRRTAPSSADPQSSILDPRPLTAIPYYAWSNRERGEMAIWLPRTAAGAHAHPEPTLASRSRVTSSFQSRDRLEALNDQFEPANSSDQSIPRMTWWDHRGTREWVQYDFPAPAEVAQVEVYWFDDTGIGKCRVPASWQLLYSRDGNWVPVEQPSTYGVARDGYNQVTFKPVTTPALRLAVQLQDGFSGGILEWRVR